MAGLRDRFSRLFDDEDDEIKTVIKETDDSSPNTKTTTITRGRGPGRDSPAMSTDTNWTSGIQAPNVGNGNMATGDTDKVLGILDGLLSEVGSGPGGQADATNPGMVMNDTRELGPLVEQGRPDYSAMDGSTDPTTDPRWLEPTQGQWPEPNPGPNTGVPGSVPGRSTNEMGGVMPNFGRQRMDLMSELDGMMTQPSQPDATMDPGMGPGSANGMPAEWTPGGPADMQFNPMYPNPQSSRNNGWGTDPNSATTYLPSNMVGGPSRPGGGRDPNSPWPSQVEQPANPEMEARHEAENAQAELNTALSGPNASEPPGLSGSREGDGWSPGAGNPQATTVKGAEKDVVDSAENDQTSYTVEGQQPTIAQTDALTRTWGKLAYDPKKRRDEYMKRLNKIYANTMALEALAIISGKPSRAGMYSQMAMGKLDAMQKFDSEDRLQQLTNALYFDKNGEYAPPENKAAAHAALMQMGASLNEATAIVGHVPAAVATDNKTYYKYDPKTNRVIARGAPSKMAPDGWGSNDWAQKEFTKNNPGADGIGTGVGVANAQYITIQEALLADMTPGTAEYANQERFIRTLKDSLDIGGGMDKAFKTMYGSMINDGDKPPKINGVRYESWEEFKKAWQDPSNNGPNSYNTYVGNDPKNSGMVTEVATASAQFIAKFPDASKDDLNEWLVKKGLIPPQNTSQEIDAMMKG